MQQPRSAAKRPTTYYTSRTGACIAAVFVFIRQRHGWHELKKHETEWDEVIYLDAEEDMVL